MLGAIVMAALIFLPAGTLDYWQGWVFFALFFVASSTIGIYLAIYNPVVLERRMNVGPTAEKEKSQKIITLFALLGFITLLVFPTLDYRFEWPPVPPYVSVVGDILVLLGFLLTFIVICENSYAASTIQVAEGQSGLNRPLRVCQASHVCRSSSNARRHATCARLMVGTFRTCSYSACAHMATH
jgi:glucan phosphoethanolaminetransferase (alkaline phosphatase superfamily)